MNNVLILGAGPVGRAVSAAFPGSLMLEAGRNVMTSRMYGAQFVYREIPGFITSPISVVTRVDHAHWNRTSVRAYKKRVGRVGDDDVLTWPEQFMEYRKAYRLKSYTGTAAAEYGRRADKIDLVNHSILDDQGRTWSYDILISTIPLPQLTQITEPKLVDVDPSMYFRSQPVYVYVEAPYAEEWDNYVDTFGGSIRKEAEHVVYVNYVGLANDGPFYRETFRDGVVHRESHMELPDRELAYVLKPGKIWNVSGDLRDELTRALAQYSVFTCGRYGDWDQEQLLHNSYDRAMRIRSYLEGK